MAEGSHRIVFGDSYDVFHVPEEALPDHSFRGRQGEDIALQSAFQVFIFQFVLDDMWRHARTSPSQECAGMLLGHPFVKPPEMEPEGCTIHFAIVAKSVRYDTPESSQGHVRITADALAAADRYARQEVPGLRPVGWYHTHPGHGIFLSGHDTVITRGIFNAPWQIAVVIDPIQNLPLGVFRGAEGERLPGYRVLRELPLELRFMQQYNQALKLLEQGDLQEAWEQLQELDGQFQRERSGMAFWRDKPGYRDVRDRLGELEAHMAWARRAGPPPQQEEQSGPRPPDPPSGAVNSRSDLPTVPLPAGAEDAAVANAEAGEKARHASDNAMARHNTRPGHPRIDSAPGSDEARAAPRERNLQPLIYRLGDRIAEIAGQAVTIPARIIAGIKDRPPNGS